mmetsp:Transcript_27338/g.56510  ORF Transcript_27338/g.56510 Transcript_27338/m.56510 type:complete len:258 (+) Transcript_27338:154-927(+)
MISNQRNALIAVLAIAALHNSEAFVAPSSSRITFYRSSLTNNSCKQRFSSRPLYESSTEQEQEVTLPAENDASSDNTSSVMEHSHEAKPIMDIPPTPSKSSLPHTDKTANKPKPKTKGNPHKEGIFSPIVVAAGSVLGQEQLNQIRAKAISLHSDIIKSFVDTSDSELGKSVLKQLFNIVDVDGSGYLDEKEVGTALKLLGFKWLEEKHVEKIFERADLDENGEICLDEFVLEAPKTLRTNLIKLAKSNGGDMGLLV